MSEYLVAIGTSAGGLQALQAVLSVLPAQFCWPIVIVMHLLEQSTSNLAFLLAQDCALPIHEALDKQPLTPGHIYVAPPDYHLLIESPQALALSVDPPLNYSRPAIDILFDSAAKAFYEQCMGILLSGASCDGSQGLLSIAQRGGTAVIQSPESAEFKVMPQSALQLLPEARVLDLQAIGPWLVQQETTSR